ncbi:MAG TPA: ABC-type transport auxiliary lipoprotein family protein [Steroidobacteraceae bacterium]|jgi:cholesterol transport system auxiliary component
MRIAIIAVAAVLAAGCFGGLKKEVEQPLLYRIDAPKLAAGPALAADLKVVVSSLAPGLDEPGIAARLPDQRLDHLAGARWAEELSALLESAFVESFQDSGRLRSVQGDLGRFRATHTLVIDVRRFEADYSGGGLPVAQVALSATLGRASDRRVLMSFTVSASEAAAENRQSSAVAALNTAFNRAVAEAAGKSFDAIAADLASKVAEQGTAGRSSEPRLAASDFEPLAGAPWNGTLTYRDYGTGGEASIASALVVSKSRPDGRAWTFEYRYPREPHADTRDAYEISGDGRMLNGERVVERSELAPDTLSFVTQQAAVDDDRPAIVRHTYEIGPGRFSIRKEVQFEGAGEFLERNRYVWTR